MSDLTKLCATFGVHVELLEVDELTSLRREVTLSQSRQRAALFRETFDVEPDCDEAEIARAARTSVAVDRRVERRGLGALGYCDKGSGVTENEDTMSSSITRSRCGATSSARGPAASTGAGTSPS